MDDKWKTKVFTKKISLSSNECVKFVRISSYWLTFNQNFFNTFTIFTVKHLIFNLYLNDHCKIWYNKIWPVLKHYGQILTCHVLKQCYSLAHNDILICFMLKPFSVDQFIKKIEICADKKMFVSWKLQHILCSMNITKIFRHPSSPVSESTFLQSCNYATRKKKYAHWMSHTSKYIYLKQNTL